MQYASRLYSVSVVWVDSLFVGARIIQYVQCMESLCRS